MIGQDIRPIGDYRNRSSAIRPYDPTCVLVAVEVIDLITQRSPYLQVEHVGSKSVPGMAGGGIIDILIVYPPGQLQSTRQSLDEMGFQGQPHPSPFPEERPMRVGSYTYQGSTYDLHIHILAENDPEVYRLKAFRDRLRYDPTLQTAYLDRKNAILKSGVRNLKEYAHAKSDFIKRALNK
jgi:GrpB-like predicted nucleotidyltransferase (UPF0157 family)